jgi:arylsulfatase A-like enzyme
MHEGVLHIPLLISAPGQDRRQDVSVPTSNVDLLPTLLWLTGREIPSGIEGQPLPGLGVLAESERLIFAVQAPYNSAFAPLKKGSVAMRKGAYKLIAYLGYAGVEQGFELYNLDEDPEELNDLFADGDLLSRQMRSEFLAAWQQANQPFLLP